MALFDAAGFVALGWLTAASPFWSVLGALGFGFVVRCVREARDPLVGLHAVPPQR